MNSSPDQSRPWQQWDFQRAITPQNIFIAFVLFVLLSISAHNTEIDIAVVKTSKALLSAVGIGDSQVLDGAVRFAGKAFPLQIAQRTEISRVEDFDPDKLPLFAYVEYAENRDYDVMTDTWSSERVEFLVEPVGYLTKV